jgi:coenzyme F420-dependent glucose-6-phosphate dehydrogenase
MVKPEDMLSSVRVSDSTEQHTEWLLKDIEAGVSNLYLHNVNTSQQQFIDVFGAKVLPALLKERSSAFTQS